MEQRLQQERDTAQTVREAAQNERETAHRREQELQNLLAAAEAQVATTAQAAAQAEVTTVNSELSRLRTNAPPNTLAIPRRNPRPKIPKPRGKVTEVWRTLRGHGVDEKDYRLMKVRVDQREL